MNTKHYYVPRLSFEELTSIEFHDVPTLLQQASTRHEINRAQREGRLHPDFAAALGVDTGQYECPTCGMRSWTANESRDCCIDIGKPWKHDSLKRKDSHRFCNYVVTDGIALAQAVKDRLGVTTDKAAELASGLHVSCLSKFRMRGIMGITQETYNILSVVFGGDVPFVVWTENFNRRTGGVNGKR